MATIQTLDPTENASKGLEIAKLNANLKALAAGVALLPVSSGTFVANGVTAVTVAAPGVTANSQVLITLKTASGAGGTTPTAGPYETTITPGTGFTVKATAGDISTYNWMVIG